MQDTRWLAVGRHLLDNPGCLCMVQTQLDTQGTRNSLCMLIHMEAKGSLKGADYWLVALWLKASDLGLPEENIPESLDKGHYVHQRKRNYSHIFFESLFGGAIWARQQIAQVNITSSEAF